MVCYHQNTIRKTLGLTNIYSIFSIVKQSDENESYGLPLLLLHQVSILEFQVVKNDNKYVEELTLSTSP